MGNIDLEKLSPALQVLIGLELENNEMKQELQQLKKDVDELKERLLNGNDFAKYPITLSVEHIAEILRIGRVQAYNIVKRRDFPKIKNGNKYLISKLAFCKWYEKVSFEDT